VLDFLATILGYVFEFIYRIGVHNLGACIILFTFVVRMLMLPMTVKQQKFTKLNAVMSPEIQAIQKKYQNKKDQQSQLAQQEEIKAVYDKYGTSPTGSCLQLIIQMPILLGLYRVIQRTAEFVPSVAALSTSEIDKANKFIVYQLNKSPSQMYSDNDVSLVIALIIPLLAGLFQFLSVQISTKLNNTNMGDNPMAGSMKAMNIMMPLFSIYMCWQFNTSIGLYWVAGSLIMMLQTIFVNIYLKKIDVNDIIEANKDKAVKKAEKRKAKQGIYREQVLESSKVNTKNLSSNSQMTSAEKEERIRKAKEAGNKNKGSLASKANMVNDYNKRNEK
jgi:YidC/Oxa1 family membrane protein insertase